MHSEKGYLVCEPEWVDYDDPAAFLSIFLALSFSASTPTLSPPTCHEREPLGR